MPPWKPRHRRNGEFVGDRIAQRRGQIQRIQDWVAQGAPEGDRRDLPPRRSGRLAGSSGTPDLVVTMPTRRTRCAADGGDVFRTFVIPIPTDAPRATSGRSSSIPAMRAPCITPTSASIARDRRGGSTPPTPSRDTSAAWCPTRLSARLHARMDAGPAAAAVARRHGVASRAGQRSRRRSCTCSRPASRKPVQVSVGFFFTDEPPTRTPVGLRLGSETIDIPAGDAALTRSPIATSCRSTSKCWPCSRTRTTSARRWRRRRRCPTARLVPLIAIADWDFRWQDVYRYAQPIALPRGTDDFDALHLRQLRRQPAQSVSPAAAGRLGTEHDGRDGRPVAAGRAAVERAISRRWRATSAERRAPKTSPPTRRCCRPIRTTRCATMRWRCCICRAATSPRRSPSFANRCGSTRSRRRRTTTSGSPFRSQRQYDARDRRSSRTRCGSIRITPTRTTTSARCCTSPDSSTRRPMHYRRAIALRPENAEAHNNLARLLSAQGQYPEAVAEFERALALNPSLPRRWRVWPGFGRPP